MKDIRDVVKKCEDCGSTNLSSYHRGERLVCDNCESRFWFDKDGNYNKMRVTHSVYDNKKKKIEWKV